MIRHQSERNRHDSKCVSNAWRVLHDVPDAEAGVADVLDVLLLRMLGSNECVGWLLEYLATEQDAVLSNS
jgi:hypothetical protein